MTYFPWFSRDMNVINMMRVIRETINTVHHIADAIYEGHFANTAAAPCVIPVALWFCSDPSCSMSSKRNLSSLLIYEYNYRYFIDYSVIFCFISTYNVYKKSHLKCLY